MNQSTLKKAATILVECKLYLHGEAVLFEGKWNIRYRIPPMQIQFHEIVKPFADTLVGRKQLEAIWKWLFENQNRYLIAGMQSEDLLRLVDREFVCQVVTRCLEQIEVAK